MQPPAYAAKSPPPPTHGTFSPPVVLEPEREPVNAAVTLLLLGAVIFGISAVYPIIGLVIGPVGFAIGFALCFAGLSLLPTATRFAGPKAAIAFGVLALAGTILWAASSAEFDAVGACPSVPCDTSWVAPYENAVGFGALGTLASMALLLAPLPARRLEWVSRKVLQCPACGALYPLGSGKFCAKDNAALREFKPPPIRRPRRTGTVVNLRRDFLLWLFCLTLLGLVVGFTARFVDRSIAWWTAANGSVAASALVAAVVVTWIVCEAMTLREAPAATA